MGDLRPGLGRSPFSEWMREPPSKTPISLTGGIGGLYWLLGILLPGFSEFRFPSKLMVLANCGLSLLAAPGLDRLAAAGSDPAEQVGPPSDGSGCSPDSRS